MITQAEAQERLSAIQTKIARACDVAKRDPAEVTLIAVSKTFSAEDIRPFLDAGHRVFGENRVQETESKWPALRAEYPDIELHLIGALQSNKAAEAVALFDVIEVVDREKLAAELAKEMKKQGKTPKLLVQLNTGDEPQKSGIKPSETHEFLKACTQNHGLLVAGLMCIPPADLPPAPHFALLDKLADEAGLKIKSMGMSADFEQAIMCGATHVRVGSALFGERG